MGAVRVIGGAVGLLALASWAWSAPSFAQSAQTELAQRIELIRAQLELDESIRSINSDGTILRGTKAQPDPRQFEFDLRDIDEVQVYSSPRGMRLNCSKKGCVRWTPTPASGQHDNSIWFKLSSVERMDRVQVAIEGVRKLALKIEEAPNATTSIPVDPKQAKPAKQKSTVKSTNPGVWRYDLLQDPRTGEPIHIARVESTGWVGSLIVRYGRDGILTTIATPGTFVCSGTCAVRVKIDGNDRMVEARPAGMRAPNVLYFSPRDLPIKLVLESSRFAAEVNIAQHGWRVVDFATSGLDLVRLQELAGK